MAEIKQKRNSEINKEVNHSLPPINRTITSNNSPIKNTVNNSLPSSSSLLHSPSYRPSTLAASGQLVMNSSRPTQAHSPTNSSLTAALSSYRSPSAVTPSSHLQTLNSGLNSLISELKNTGSVNSSDLALTAVSGAVADAKALILLEDQRQRQRKVERELLRHQFKVTSSLGNELHEKQKYMNALESQMDQLSSPEIEDLNKQIATATGREKDLLIKRLDLTERMNSLKLSHKRKPPSVFKAAGGVVTSPLNSMKAVRLSNQPNQLSSSILAHPSGGQSHSDSHSASNQLSPEEMFTFLKAAGLV
jgi:hypothetical protein